jgi:hypothetical protein
MEEFDIYFETKDLLSARNAAEMLLCLATMRDALSIAANGGQFVEVGWWGLHRPQAQEGLYFVESVDSIRGPFPLHYFLKEVGKDVLSTGKRPFGALSRPAKRALLSIDEIDLEYGYTPRGLELSKITTGSVWIRVKEAMDSIAAQLRHLIKSAEGSATEKEPDAFYFATRQILSDAKHERELAAGLIVISGLTLEWVARHRMQATQIDVQQVVPNGKRP